MTGLQDDEIRAVATVNRDPIAVVCAELMRRGRMPSVSELMLGTATWTWGLDVQWIGLRENLQETIDFPMKIMGLSCKFSLKPIH